MRDVMRLIPHHLIPSHVRGRAMVYSDDARHGTNANEVIRGCRIRTGYVEREGAALCFEPFGGIICRTTII